MRQEVSRTKSQTHLRHTYDTNKTKGSELHAVNEKDLD